MTREKCSSCGKPLRNTTKKCHDCGGATYRSGPRETGEAWRVLLGAGG